jgi:mono/diheme cytochrome c family protein
MNTSKQVNVMIGLMFVLVIGTFLYFVWDDARADDAGDRQIVENAERGGGLYSLNCRSCHGLNGLGPLERYGNLPGLALNVPQLNRPVDPDTGEVDIGALITRQARIRDTIRCGRVGTLMPQWAEETSQAILTALARRAGRQRWKKLTTPISSKVRSWPSPSAPRTRSSC